MTGSLPSNASGNPANRDAHQQTRTGGDAYGFEGLALDAMRGLVPEVFEPFDSVLHSPHDSPRRVSAFFAGVSGHRFHQTHLMREVRRMPNSVGHAIGDRCFRYDPVCLCDCDWHDMPPLTLLSLRIW